MPSGAVQTFSDADQYAAAIRGGAVEFTVTGRGDFNAKLVRIDLHRLWIQRFSESLPRIADVTGLVGGRTYITFRTKPGPSLLQSGMEIDPSAVLRFGQAHDYYQHSSGTADFATMSLPTEDIASIAEAMSGLDVTVPADTISVRPARTAMASLQRLHAAAGGLPESAPEIIANPDAARGLEQTLIEAMVDCLGHEEGRENSQADGRMRPDPRQRSANLPPRTSHANETSPAACGGRASGGRGARSRCQSRCRAES